MGATCSCSGGKYSDFEGGTNTLAFAAGGMLADRLRGTEVDALISAADWYGTFADAAGVVGWEHDAEAVAAGLPPVDSISHWSLLTATASTGAARVTAGARSNRTMVHLSSQAIVVGTYKLITGVQVMAGWQGPSYPNDTHTQPMRSGDTFDCGSGCLFDLSIDPTEHVNLAKTQPDMMVHMLGLLVEANMTLFAPDRGQGDPRACLQAVANGGFYGPWLDL